MKVINIDFPITAANIVDSITARVMNSSANDGA